MFLDTPSTDGKSKSNPFGAARAVDIDSKMAERSLVETDMDSWRGGAQPQRNQATTDKGAKKEKDDGDNWRSGGAPARGGGKGSKDGKDGKSKAKGRSDNDFASLRGRNQMEAGIEMVNDPVEEAAEDGFTMISAKSGKAKKSSLAAGAKEEADPVNVIKSKFAVIESDDEEAASDDGDKESRRQGKKEEDVLVDQEAAEDDEDDGEDNENEKSEEDEESSGSEEEALEKKTESGAVSNTGNGGGKQASAEGKTNSKESTTESARGESREEKKEALKKTASATGGYVPPAVRKRLEEEEKQKKAAEERRAAKEAEEQERKRGQAIEDEKNAKKNAIQAELDAQKRRRDGEGMEEAAAMKAAALQAKQRKEQDEKAKRELAKIRKTRFTTNHDPVLMQKLDQELKSSFPRSLKAENFDASLYFPSAEEKEKNIYHALLLFCRKILFTGFTEDEIIFAVESSKASLQKLLATGQAEASSTSAASDSASTLAIELLYAGTRIMAEMKNPSTKQLPDYNKETSVIESFFYELYRNEIVTEGDVLAWFDDEEDETPGRMEVLFQVTPFVHFLRPPPEEVGDGEDENGSDEGEEEGEDDEE
eukprot:g8280.t1